MPNLLSSMKRSDPTQKKKPRKAHALTQENLLTHNALMPPARESKQARVTQYVSSQSSFNYREKKLHHVNSKYFRPPSIHTLEDVPNPQERSSKDLDDSVSMMGRRRRKARIRLWLHRIIRTLKQLVPKMGKPHGYPT